jgi:hypothetical protein
MVAVVALPILAWIVALGARPSALLMAAAAAIGCWEYYRLTLGSIGFFRSAPAASPGPSRR